MVPSCLRFSLGDCTGLVLTWRANTVQHVSLASNGVKGQQFAKQVDTYRIESKEDLPNWTVLVERTELRSSHAVPRVWSLYGPPVSSRRVRCYPVEGVLRMALGGCDGGMVW